MKTASTFLALAAVAQAHYNFPALTSEGKATTDWQYVRQWTNYYSYLPVTDVSSDAIRCNVDGTTKFASASMSVAAGSNVGMTASPNIYHPGPLLVYMAKVPAGSTAENWDGAGEVWFKIAEEGPIFHDGAAISWPTDSVAAVNFTIPAATPSGDYLLRVEHIGLHVAQSKGAAQFYLSCGQITVTGGGSGTPGPLVAFPGAYSATDPGILISIYSPVPTSYTMPGPAIWTGEGASSSSGSTGSTGSSGSSGSTDPAPASSAAAAAAPAPSPAGPTVAKYGQCGGIGWNGATVCEAGSTCTASGSYYSQCM